MDRDEDERNKGKTVECGKAYFRTKHKRYTILDAPGHLHYVSNMIMGATMADVALLVISARKGEFEAGFTRGGQTREHALIALTLGITRVVVVINKMDTIQWNQERYLLIKESLGRFLCKDIGFKKKYIWYVPVCGQIGMNIKAQEQMTCNWYDGDALLDILDGLKPIKRKIKKKALRIPVVDRFKVDGALQVMGRIQTGMIRKGDRVKIVPSQVVTNVIDLCMDDEKRTQMKCVTAGENVLITLDKSAVRMDLVYRGCVMCDVDEATPVVQEFIAEIYVHEVPKGGVITKGYQAMFHCHNVCLLCEIIGMKKSKKGDPFLRAHDGGMVKFKLVEKCALETFEECRVLGRFILRDHDKTVMMGKIKKVIPVLAKKNKRYQYEEEEKRNKSK
eukprot:180156_1